MAADPRPARRPRLTLHARTRDAVLPGGLLALGLALVFHADLLGGSDLLFKATRDISPLISLYPWSRLAAASWREGLFPLWNPYNFLGLPLLGNYQSSVLSPLMLPLYLPLEWVTVPYLLGRLWLAGMGAWWLGRRLGLGRWPAVIPALAFGLTGYFTQHVAVQHLVIDLLLPFFFIAGHDLVRRRRLRDFFFFAGLTLLALLGGQPGAALFTLAPAYGYALVAAVATAERRAGRVLLVAGAGALASAVATIQLLPFFEFIPQAWTFHLPGFGTAFIPPSGAVTALAPGFWGPLDRAREVLPLVKIAPYYGLVPAVLAGAGLLAPRRLVEKWFAFCLVISTFILLGLPPLSWLVALPGLDRLTYIKYLQPVVALALAMLAGRGAQELLAGKGRWAVWLAAKLAAGAVIVAAIVLALRHHDHALMMLGAVLTTAATAVVVAAIALLACRPSFARRAVPALAVLCLLELVLASSVNRTIVFRNVAREDFSNIRKALGCKDWDSCATIEGLSRLAASEDLLIPEQNLLVPYREIGAAEVMFIRESCQLVRELTGQSEREFVHDYLKYHAVQVRRGFEVKNSAIASMLGLRAFLSRLPPPDDRLERMLSAAQVLTFSPEAVHKTIMEISGDAREGIFAHAPSRLTAPPEPGSLDFAVGVDPRAAALAGDGVWFQALTGASLAYARYLDPRRGDKFWVQASAPLSSGLALVTLPAGSYQHDWAVWGDTDSPSPITSGTFLNLPGVRHRQDGGADHVTAWRSGMKHPLLATPPLACRSLHARETDNFQAVLQYLSECSVTVPPGSGAAGLPAAYLIKDAERLQSARFERLPISEPSLAILSDAYYPGWKVFVDGKERKIVRANHGLRGVKVKPGDHVVEFLYQPWSFRIGLWFSLVSLIGGVVLVAIMRQRSDKE